MGLEAGYTPKSISNVFNICLADISPDSSSLTLLKTQCSITLETTQSKEIERSFSTYAFSFFLWTGTMFASFYSLGMLPLRRDLLNNTVKDGAMIGAVSLRSLAGISSGPVAFFRF